MRFSNDIYNNKKYNNTFNKINELNTKIGKLKVKSNLNYRDKLLKTINKDIFKNKRLTFLKERTISLTDLEIEHFYARSKNWKINPAALFIKLTNEKIVKGNKDYRSK